MFAFQTYTNFYLQSQGQIMQIKLKISCFSSKMVVILICFCFVKSQVQIRCGNCTNSSCGSNNLCAKYYGQGFVGQQQCISSCQGYPIVYYPSYCEIDSNNNNCIEKCCVSLGRTSTALRTCTANLSSVFTSTTYCDQILTNAAGFGIMLGTLIFIIAIVAVACCILRNCGQDPNQNKPYKPKKQRLNRRKKFTIANFYESNSWRIFQQRNQLRQQEQPRTSQHDLMQNKGEKRQRKMKNQNRFDNQGSLSFENTNNDLKNNKKIKRMAGNQQVYEAT